MADCRRSNNRWHDAFQETPFERLHSHTQLIRGFHARAKGFIGSTPCHRDKTIEEATFTP